MAYESLLNVLAAAQSVASYTYSAATTGLSANILLNINNTTLGNNLGDDVAYLTVQTGLSSAVLSLSSFSTIPTTINYIGSIVSSTFNTNLSSAQIAINFPVSNALVNVNLPTTNLYLSGNKTTVVFDSTQNSTLDNFFWASINPAENTNDQPNAVRTTAGHARIVAALG